MRVFITGDTHGDWSRIYNFVDRMSLNHRDTLIIILGDAGLYWKKDGSDAQEKIDFHEQNYEFQLAFIDGNHENFDLLKQHYSDNGICAISEHIYWFMRGATFTIDGKSFLCMGGADSVDRFRRIKNISWWEDEKITKEDIAKVDKTQHYDFVLTHAAPQSIVDEYKWKLCILLIAEDLIDHSSQQELEELFKDLDYDKHYFGHYHSDVALDDKHTCLLNDFIELI